VTLESASPGEVKSGGAGWAIVAGFAESPFGTCLIAEGPRGICHLSFVESTNRRDGATAITTDWPAALVVWNDAVAERVGAALFKRPTGAGEAESLRAFVRGTPFQVRVWRALLRIPKGTLVSYSRIAEAVCGRDAARAVGSAVGANRLAYLIPCHRVIRETGIVGDYRWGTERKRAMIAWENAPARIDQES
jgi:AraC family transcriptional regulator of adaptative response/methylated-DNA-[protein]-cysteine methyltransferase